MNPGLSGAACTADRMFWKALPLGHFFREAGAAGGEIEYLADAGADESVVLLDVSHDAVLGHHPALQVRRIAHGPVLLVLGDHVRHFGAVPGGVYIRIRRLHKAIHRNSAAVPHSKAGIGGQFAVGPDADGEDHVIAGYLLAVGKFHTADPALIAVETGDRLAGDDPYALGFHVVLYQPGHIPIEKGQDLIQHLQHGHFNSRQCESLAGFDADEPAPYHHRVLHLLVHRDLLESHSVLHALEGINSFEFDSGYGRNHRRGSGGQDQLIVRKIPLFSGVQGAHPHRPVIPVDGQGFGLDERGNAFHLGKEIRIPGSSGGGGNELPRIIEYSADEIRISAGCH
jgi:hypothetical protein